MLLALLLACASSPTSSPTASPASAPYEGPPSFLVVDIDSWRADRLTATREGEPIAPTMAGLAARGVRFDQAYSQSGWTIPAVYSLLTGRYPLLIEVQGDTLPQRDPAVRHLPEILGYYGYRSALYWGQTILAGNDRLSPGFELTSEGNEGDYLLPLQEWIAQAPDTPFLAVVHNLDLHMPGKAMPAKAMHRFVPAVPECPGRAPAPALGRLVPVLGPQAAQEHIIGHYDGQVRHYDDAVADLLAQLERAGVADRTVVILTSDHGEELFERGELRHGVHYDPVLHVPLVIADPRQPGARAVDTVVQTVDLAPTILELAGVPADVGMHGQSLVSLMAGTDGYEQRDVLSISNRYNASLRTPTHKALIRSLWTHHAGEEQMVEGGRSAELYDLAHDPMERRDLGEAEVGAALFARLDAFVAERLSQTQQVPREPMSPDQERKLKEGGYWGLANPEGPTSKPPLPGDPEPPPDLRERRPRPRGTHRPD